MGNGSESRSRACREERSAPWRHLSAPGLRKTRNVHPCAHRRCNGNATESRGNPSPWAGSAVGRASGGRNGRSGVAPVIDEILEFLARLEERNPLRRHLHFSARLGIAARAAPSLARAEAAKSADFNLVVFLQGVNDAFEDGLDDRLRFFARQLRYADHFFDQIRLRHRASVVIGLTRSARHGSTALLVTMCLDWVRAGTCRYTLAGSASLPAQPLSVLPYHHRPKT